MKINPGYFILLCGPPNSKEEQQGKFQSSTDLPHIFNHKVQRSEKEDSDYQ